MSSSTRQVNKKAVKVFQFWFCSRCLQKVDMAMSQVCLDIPFRDPNELSKALEKIGFKLSCKVCGNTTFVKKEFSIPIEDIVEKELAKQLKEYMSSNQNPTRRT
jgi:hypothetical protein